VETVDIDVGRRIAGKYELVRLLGKGAMGEVWLATHDSLGGEFAIKLVRPSEEPEDETAAGRFQLEAQVSAKLSRKTRHIVSVSDHGEEDGLAYLVMELLDGESLEARIKRGGALDLATTVAIVTQIARALGQAHGEGIFHRDLKPANVFLTKDEDGRLLVKLLDFGIARTQKPFRTRSPFMTGKDMVLGTPSYMSPEQARGLDSLDHRCDLWALAVVAYEALTKRIPWEGDTVEDIFLSICTHRMVAIRTLRADLPPEVDALFAKSFAPKLDARFASAAELAEAFEALVDPAELEAALGIRAPHSSRRLPTSGRGSDPSIGSAPGGVVKPLETTSDPVGFTVGEGTSHTRKKRSSGWLLAGVAALLTVGVVGFTLLRTRMPAAPASPPPAETTALTNAPPTNDRGSIPPPEPVVTTALPIATTTPTSPVAKGPKSGVRAPGPPVREPTTPTANAHAATPAQVPTPPVTPPPQGAATTTPATPKKPLDKSEVF